MYIIIGIKDNEIKVISSGQTSRDEVDHEAEVIHSLENYLVLSYLQSRKVLKQLTEQVL